MTIKAQSEKLKEAARELDCDEDEKHFDAIVKKLAKSKPEKDVSDDAGSSEGQ